jgi:tetratricopeptide (TPR) repeat protein
LLRVERRCVGRVVDDSEVWGPVPSCPRASSEQTIRIKCLLPVACIVLAIVCGLSVAVAQGSSPDTRKIAAALQTREFTKALELLRPALQQMPGDARLWAMQGTAYAGSGNKSEALDSFRNALRISPDYLPALQGAVQIEYDNGSAAGIPLLKRLLRLRPEDATGHGMLAVLEYQQGDCGNAVVHFEKAKSLFDGQVSALHAYAACLVKIHRFGEAAKVQRHVVDLETGSEKERQLLAAVQLMAHQPADALTTLQPSDLDKASPETLELLATAYEDNGETPKAVATLRRAILLDPHNVNLYLDFANMSSAHDSFQVGVDVMSDGINQLPQAAPLYLARGVLYVQLAQYEKAEADFDTAQRLDPRQSLSSAARGVLAGQQDNLEQALTTVQRELKTKPRDALLLYLQADFLSQKGAEPGTVDFQLALRSAKQAVSLQPNLSGARTVLAKLELQVGNPNEAVEQCRKALEHDPKDQTALYHLIQGLRKTGDQSEIPDLLKRLAEIRKQAAREQSHRYQYKLVEDDTQPK